MARATLSYARRPVILTALIVMLATVALLPVSALQLGSTTSFVPAMLAVVACFDLLSIYLLVGVYRDQGDPRLLVMSWAYAWSLVLMGGYALAFPGVAAEQPPLALTPSMAPYFYIAWHGGFPTLVGLAWAPWPKRWTNSTAPARRTRAVKTTLAIAVSTAIGTVAALATFSYRLPVLIDGLDLSGMTRVTAPVTIPLVVLALIAAIWGTRQRSGPERWTAAVVLVCLCDLTLTYYSGTRYSLGWYSGRCLTLVSAGLVVFAMLAELRRLKSEAEHHATYDALTGLQNRRSAYDALDALVARSRRSNAPVGIVSFDLDGFKQVNDRYGHHAGDGVLKEVGRLLGGACRQGDVLARVGGEEFLVILPDADEAGTLVVAEKIRRVVASVSVPGTSAHVTASVGATALSSEDHDSAALLRRVDSALYLAKNNGKNRVVAPERRRAEGILEAGAYA